MKLEHGHVQVPSSKLTFIQSAFIFQDQDNFESTFSIEIIWLVVWNINFIFPYIGNNHPNWLIFFRGVAQPPTSLHIWGPEAIPGPVAQLDHQIPSDPIRPAFAWQPVPLQRRLCGSWPLECGGCGILWCNGWYVFLYIYIYIYIYILYLYCIYGMLMIWSEMVPNKPKVSAHKWSLKIIYEVEGATKYLSPR